MSGRGPRLFSLPPRIGALPVGSTIKLNVASTPWEFLVVHQGLPSDMYDASCDGTWMLMKDIYENRAWNSSDVNNYETSAIDTWLNGDFLGLLDSNIQGAIKQAKIPYRVNKTIMSGTDGLPVKIFLLSVCEVGSAGTNTPKDGAKLDYFTASSGGDSKRIAYLNGSATIWWLRSPNTGDSSKVWRVGSDGRAGRYPASSLLGIRPAFILPSDFIVTEDMIA